MPLQSLWNLIPTETKNSVFDALIEAVVSRGEGLISDSLLDRIGGLRSDANFRKRFNTAVQRAIQRFLDEYIDQDEDLVEAITEQIDTVFADEQVRETLLAIIRNPSGYHVENKDKLIDAFDTVLTRRRNRERVDRAVSYLLKCIAEEVWHLPELQPVYLLQMARVSAEANTLTAQVVQEQLRIAKLQLQATAELNAGIRDAMLQLSDGLANRLLLEAGEESTQPKVKHNLPSPTYETFVGRSEELRELHHHLHPTHTRSFLITIAGIGGIGKSSLALETAYHYVRNYTELPNDERFDTIVWVSAKQDMLTPQGIVPRHHSVDTLTEVYTEIALTFDREDITRTPQERQGALVKKLLSEYRTLFILDNFETIDDLRLLSFLQELPLPSKAVITTRHRIDLFLPIYTLTMKQLNWEDAKILIDQECQRRGQSVILSQSDSEQLYKRTGGIPLALEWCIGQLRVGVSMRELMMRLAAATNDITLFCFEGSIRLLEDQASYDLMLALSMFVTAASPEALARVIPPPASISVTEVSVWIQQKLVKAEQLSLINRREGRIFLLPLTEAYCRAKLEEKPDMERLYRRRLAFYYREFVQTRAEQGKQFQAASQEVDNVLGMIQWCWEQGEREYKLLLQLFYGVDGFLWRFGRWEEYGHYLDLAYEVSVILESVNDQAKLLIDRASLYQYQNKLSECEVLLEKVIPLCEIKKLDSYYVQAIAQYAFIQIERGEIKAARKLIDDAVPAANRCDSASVKTRLQGMKGVVEYHQGNYESSHKSLKMAMTQFEESDYYKERTHWIGSWVSLWMGRVLMALEEMEGSYDYLQRALEIASEVQSKQDTAESLMRFAYWHGAQGQHRKGVQMAKEARNYYQQLAMLHRVAEADAFIVQFQEAGA